MVERKKQLGNVAFGGNWSEEILIVGELKLVLAVIEGAVAESIDRDVFDADLRAALEYVCAKIEKGPMLVEAFKKGLRIENQGMRHTELHRVYQMIHNWAGL